MLSSAPPCCCELAPRRPLDCSSTRYLCRCGARCPRDLITRGLRTDLFEDGVIRPRERNHPLTRWRERSRDFETFGPKARPSRRETTELRNARKPLRCLALQRKRRRVSAPASVVNPWVGEFRSDPSTSGGIIWGSGDEMCGGSVGSPLRSCVVSLCCAKSYGVSSGDAPTLRVAREVIGLVVHKRSADRPCLERA